MRSRDEYLLAESLRVHKLVRLFIVAWSTVVVGSVLGLAFLAPYVELNAHRSQELQESREAPVVERRRPPAAAAPHRKLGRTINGTHQTHQPPK